jgi:GNAT superfamily N-acetyltransferase
MLVAEQQGQLIGFVDFHQRKDGQLTLYHIVVLANRRRQGIGYALLSTLQAIAQDAACLRIVLKCPVNLEANLFLSTLWFSTAPYSQWAQTTAQCLALEAIVNTRVPCRSFVCLISCWSTSLCYS